MTSSLTTAPARPQSLRQTLRDFGRPPRIVGLDIARGIAVIGMIAAHTLETSAMFVWSDPETWTALANGRPSILFALLAGISIALMTGRTQVPERSQLGSIRLRLVARGVMIFAIGLVLELLGTNIAIILTFYGIVYVVAMLFVGLRVRTLVIWAAALAVAGPALQAGLVSVSPFGFGEGTTLMLHGTYSIFVWTSLMLAGLALGRLELTRATVAAGALAIGVAMSSIGYSVGVLWGPGEEAGWSSSVSSASSSASSSAYAAPVTPGDEVDLSGLFCEDYGDGFVSCYPPEYFEEMPEDEPIESQQRLGGSWDDYIDMVQANAPLDMMSDALLASSPHSGGTMELFGSGGLALALVGLLLLVGRGLRHALLPIAAVGSMPLTAYTTHVVVIWIVGGPGGWIDDPAFFWWLTGAVLVGCTAWALLVGRGPLERLTAYVSKRVGQA